MPQLSPYVSNIKVRLLRKKNTRRLTERGLLPTRNMLLLVETTLGAPATIGLKSVVAQKTSVATAKPKVMM